MRRMQDSNKKKITLVSALGLSNFVINKSVEKCESMIIIESVFRFSVTFVLSCLVVNIIFRFQLNIICWLGANQLSILVNILLDVL
jgi:hypothetical protein